MLISPVQRIYNELKKLHAFFEEEVAHHQLPCQKNNKTEG